MDLNQLLYNHQLAIMNATQSCSTEDRATYFDLIGYYAKRIDAWRSDAGISPTGWLHDERSSPIWHDLKH